MPDDPIVDPTNVTKQSILNAIMAVQDTPKQTFATGAQRDVATGKGRFDLISPIFLTELALRLEKGAVQYGDRNWEKGMPFSRVYDSLTRHLTQWSNKQEDEDHLINAACNLMFLIHYRAKIRSGELPPDLQNMGPPINGTAQSSNSS